MRPLAVLGCTSSAGKSLLVCALARWFARRGVRVAPFKAQNMSNNARVVARGPGRDGWGEIGVAQWLQASAAGVEPDVRMNPVLVKPEADTASTVVVDGRVDPGVSALPWTERAPVLWPAMAGAWASLSGEFDLVLIEGAGSPAEVNLPDLVNNRIVAHTGAAAILVADIDRGGAFAHLVGTHALVPPATRRALAGFVLNRFRGDPRLLGDAPALVTRRTGMAGLGVLPWLDHELPDEEGATVRSSAPPDAPRWVVVRGPWASNLDEWAALARVAHVRWATVPADLGGADVVVLPGSKHVAADLAWMRSRGLDVAVRAAAAAGTPVVGVCGGAMMAGTVVDDPDGIEGAAPGLGLMGLATTMARPKVVRRVGVRFDGPPAPWSRLAGRCVDGYEIRHGRVRATGGDPPVVVGRTGDGEPVAWAAGPVLATTVHGLFEDPGVLAALCGRRPPPVLEPTFELLADAVDRHLDTSRLWSLVTGT